MSSFTQSPLAKSATRSAGIINNIRSASSKTESESGDTKTISGETETDKVVDTLTNTDIIKKSTELSRDEFINTIAKLMDPLIGTKKESVDVKPIVEEINRFKQLIK